MLEREWQKDWEMCKEATPEPWEVEGIGGIHMDGERDAYVIVHNGSRLNKPHFSHYDARFIAESRQALPYWLRRVRKAEELLQRVIDVLPQRMFVDNVNPPQCMTIKRSRQLPELCETMCKGNFCEDKRLRDEIEAFLNGE